MKQSKCHSKEEIIRFVMELEGGYSNHVKDAGGETFWGVTHIGYADSMGLKKKDINWPLEEFTEEDAVKVYEHIWDKLYADLLPEDMRLLVFAFGVNAGYRTSTKLLQKTLGLSTDGIIGPLTQGCYLTLGEMPHAGVKHHYVELIMKHYRAQPEFGTFGTGWTNRVLATLTY